MKIFNSAQTKQLDQYTMVHEPISSLALMERAAEAICNEYLQIISDQNPVCILAGPGNNGGDALAVARMLLLNDIDVQVILLYTGKLSPDCETNLFNLQNKYPLTIQLQENTFKPPVIGPDTIIVDGLFGSGLSRPLEGIYAQAVDWINLANCPVVAIDIPSGLYGEGISPHDSFIVKADHTIGLQFPKLSFFHSENEIFTGLWSVVDIGLHQQGITKTESAFFLTEQKEIADILKSRTTFSHKGTYGHGLIVAGSEGMAGAAVLSSMGALRSGIGLLTVCSCHTNREIIQCTAPEALFIDNQSLMHNFHHYNAIAIGPGIDVDSHSETIVRIVLSKSKVPIILDADALNIIALKKDLLTNLPPNSILTPHPKEFDRIFGHSDNTQLRLEKAIKAAVSHQVIIILKGAYSAVILPSGEVHFNSTGNTGMATGGSGDVLTGIVLGLCAQSYTPAEAAILGVYVHGLAADIALNSQSEESLIARDIVKHIGAAYKNIRKSSCFLHKISSSDTHKPIRKSG